MQSLDLEVIKNTSLIQEPCRALILKNLVYPHVQEELYGSYPDFGFKEAFRKEGAGKKYCFEVFPLISNGIFKEETSLLPQCFGALLNDCLSKAYINALEEKFHLELASCRIDVGLFRFRPGDWVEAHIDRDPKVLTHLFYFNQKWNEDWGGELHLLEGPDALSDTKVMPLSFHSIALPQSPKAWHKVTPLRQHAEKRLSLQVEFWRKST